jgi:transglutaminase-like putative cysteine protease
MRRLGVFIVFLFCLTVAGECQNSKVAKEPAPPWITNSIIDYNLSSLDKDAEDGYVDLDYEKQMSVTAQTKYYRTAIKILSDAGVENSSEVSVDFDPSYERLAFHSLKIIRGKETIDKLASVKFKVVQQEKGLEQHLYDGSLTAMSILEDVRKGDVIEYSYSIKGVNPIFRGRFASFLDVQFSVPIYNLIYKLIIPSERVVTIKNRGTDIKPFVQQSGGDLVYEWKLNQVQALHVPDHTPGWFDPYPMVMVSEYKSWKEVAGWATPLYPFDVKLSTALENKIQEIASKNSDAETRTVSALRFVQDEIRYTGIEAGENSHKPHHPNQIFAQRFGDCKDKSYLLCVMLRRMGIQADPVLISTDVGRAIEEWLPSPGIFDHVTVRAAVDGQTYWFDPTISYQRGSIKAISYPDYQCGLVISESSDALTKIPMGSKGVISSKETFNVPDMSGLAHLVVKTEYSGKYADNVREDFETNSHYEMLKRYKEYYSGSYENISADSISYEDDEKTGVATTFEYYTIKDFWKLKDGITQAHLDPFLINGALKKPEETNRNYPYTISYPANYKEQIELNLPGDWGNSESSDVIKTPSSVFKYHYSGKGRRVVLNYEYSHLKDFIAPGELQQYLAAYKKIDDNSGYLLTYNNNRASSGPVKSTAPKSIFPAMYILLTIAVLITMAVRSMRKRDGYSG